MKPGAYIRASHSCLVLDAHASNGAMTCDQTNLIEFFDFQMYHVQRLGTVNNIHQTLIPFSIRGCGPAKLHIPTINLVLPIVNSPESVHL